MDLIGLRGIWRAWRDRRSEAEEPAALGGKSATASAYWARLKGLP